jgi:hypothetical protein
MLVIAENKYWIWTILFCLSLGIFENFHILRARGNEDRKRERERGRGKGRGREREREREREMRETERYLKVKRNN